MEPEHALRPAGRLGDGRDRQGAGIRREQDVRRRLGVERPEDRPLELEVLERCFDDERGLGRQAVEDVGVPKPGDPAVDPCIDRVGVEVQLRRPPGQPFAHPSRGPLDSHVVDVVDDDLPAGLERDLGDPGAHHAGPHDPDGRHTDLRASNGCRQPRQ